MDAFWEKVPERPFDGCWNWAASLRNGYGQIKVAGIITYAHRLSYELSKGAIPRGLIVRHRCDNKLCVRPEHLELGTQAENIGDMMARGRHRPVHLFGQKNPAAKLNDQQTKEIVLSGLSLRELSDRYGVTPQRIHQIRRARQLGADGVPFEVTS